MHLFVHLGVEQSRSFARWAAARTPRSPMIAVTSPIRWSSRSLVASAGDSRGGAGFMPAPSSNASIPGARSQARGLPHPLLCSVKHSSNTDARPKATGCPTPHPLVIHQGGLSSVRHPNIPLSASDNSAHRREGNVVADTVRKAQRLSKHVRRSG